MSESLDLAHNYETDLCLLDIRIPIIQGDGNEWKSALYAILEAACDELEIARDDIGGSLHPSGPKTWSIVLFDKVPGGAGNVLLVEESMERVLKAALKEYHLANAVKKLPVMGVCVVTKINATMITFLEDLHYVYCAGC